MNQIFPVKMDFTPPRRRTWIRGPVVILTILLCCVGGGWLTGWVLNHVWESYVICILAAFVFAVPVALVNAWLTNDLLLVSSTLVTVAFFACGGPYLAGQIQGVLGPEIEVTDLDGLADRQFRYAQLPATAVAPTPVAVWSERHRAQERQWLVGHALFALEAPESGLYLHYSSQNEQELAAAASTLPRWVKRLENQAHYAEYVETISPRPAGWVVFEPVESPEADRGVKIPLGGGLAILMVILALLPIRKRGQPVQLRKRRKMGPYR